MKTTERVKFRLINMPCCGHLLCWVNPRFPLYCPECGKYIYTTVRTGVVHSDDNAELVIDT
jgi:hypothetical protein